MNTLINSLNAESYKQRHSLFRGLSIVLPIMIAVVLASYFKVRTDAFNSHTAYLFFFEAIAMGSPLVISIISGLIISQEKKAGNFKNLLGINRHKKMLFFGKTLFMILSYSVSLLLAVGVYFLLLKFWIGYDVSLMPFFFNIINFSLCAIFLYFFYNLLSYNLGSGLTSIFGIGGLVIAALSFTGQGDRIWFYLPWAWSHRFSLFIYAKISQLETLAQYANEASFIMGILSAIILITAMIGTFFYWIERWEV